MSKGFALLCCIGNLAAEQDRTHAGRRNAGEPSHRPPSRTWCRSLRELEQERLRLLCNVPLCSDVRLFKSHDAKSFPWIVALTLPMKPHKGTLCIFG